ncbi:transposase [Synechococcus sp. CBW1004]|uniref:IS66 family transposase n=1 Tax=Synechococcus sp. CBW1004 TaxID=1353136 RepID=UPI00351B0385
MATGWRMWSLAPSVAAGLWTFLEIEEIEPTNNAAERALRQSVIQHKISHCVQSR